MCSEARSSLRMWRGVAILAFASLLAGCSSKGTVSGKVFYKGKPVPVGRVTFLEDTGAFHSVIAEDGSYKVTGLPPGPAAITVSSPDPPQSRPKNPMEKAMESMKGSKSKIAADMAKHMGDPDAGKRQYLAIPKHYEDSSKSGLSYTVKSGVQEFDIQLK